MTEPVITEIKTADGTLVKRRVIGYAEWRSMVDQQVCRFLGVQSNEVDAPYERYWDLRLSARDAALAAIDHEE